jgi:hypothetical protein
MTTTKLPPTAGRGKLFYFFVCTCLVLALLCSCLVLVVILLRGHLSACDVKVSRAATGRSSLAEDTSMQFVHKPPPHPWESDYHLPSDTKPIHYDIFLHPDLSNSTFSGKVIIQIHVKNPRSFLLVNAKYLDIYDTRLVRLLAAENEEESDKAGEEREIDIEDAFEYKPNEFWVIVVKNNTKLQRGIYNLHLQFRGSLSGKIVGFYSSTYTDPKTQEKRLVFIIKKDGGMYNYLQH